MPKPLDGATGERMELPAYYTDFQKNYANIKEFWKLERGQVYAEPGDASWEAFNSGDWEAAMSLLETRREDLTSYFREHAARGTVGRRVRIVSLPPTPYLQWELHVLRLRDELGEPIRILQDVDMAGFEDEGSLPDIYTMGRRVMYQAIYDDHGVLEHALKYTDQALVSRCRDFIADLYAHGEPINSFFEREIAPLPPPHPAEPAIPADYLERTGRPGPIRS
jgi:hypothetical protein